MTFGVFASIALAFVTALPSVLTSIVAGLAMINVLYSSFKEAFNGNKFKYGALFSLIIAMSEISIFNISAPLWALAGGIIVSILVEPNDFKNIKK